MSTFLQTNQGDFDFSSHNLAVVKDTAHCVGIKLTNRFNFWQGTWYQDIRQGFPYLNNVVGMMAPNMEVIAQLFKRAILQTPGVNTVQSASAEFIGITRTLVTTFTVIADSGVVLTGGTGSPFIVVQGGSGQS